MTRKSCLKKDASQSSLVSSSSESTPTRAPSCTTKRVCWGDLIIREFPSILGDNPAVSSGAPLTIGWIPYRTETVNLDYHEFVRQRGQQRRSRKKLVMSSVDRSAYLIRHGYSITEVIRASDDCEMIRKSRNANMKGAWRELFRHAVDVVAFVTLLQKEARQNQQQPRIVAAKCG